MIETSTMGIDMLDTLYYEEAGEETETSWSIVSDSMADWAVRKVLEEQAENKRLHDIAEEQIAQIKEKLRIADDRLERKTSYLTYKLQNYFDKVPHKETKTQAKYQLLSGSLVYTKPKVAYEKDDESLVQYFKESNQTEYLQVEVKPKWGEFKKQLSVVDGNVINAETGEIVECVKAVNTPEKFEVKG